MSYRNVDPETAFLQTQAVLEGTDTSESGASVAKMIRIIVGDTDVRVDRHGLFVQFPRRRRLYSYFPGLAPPSFAQIIATAKFEMPIRSPQRKVLDPSKLPLGPLLLAWRHDVHSVWLFPEPDGIGMSVRRGVHDDLTPLAEWAPAQKTYVVLGDLHPCPRCMAAQKRFRELDAIMICLACGCSFKPGQDLVLDVVERTEEMS